MCWRWAILLGIGVLSGCSGTQPRVPPPGTGAYGQPNNYYQPPATPYVPPTYGAPTSTPPGTIPPAGFGQMNPAPNNAVSFAPNGATSGANWQPVTRPAAIGNTTGNTVHPQTTLTTVKTPAANSFVNTNNAALPEMRSTPGAAPPAVYAPPPYNAALPPPNFGGASAADPWRGR